ncbi:MAG: Gldg family protein [Hyphomonadaceae bacterium]
MKRPLFTRLAAALLVVLFVCSQVISQNWLTALRVDTTQDQLYTLSADTKAVLRDIKQPIELRLYLSREALTEDPVMRGFSQRVADLLSVYAREANGQIRLSIIDPKPFSAREEEALKAGLTPIPGPRPDDATAFLGLVLKSPYGRDLVVPLLDPADAASLEFQVTRAVIKLSEPNRTRVAMLTSLPWLVATDPESGTMRPVAEIASLLMQETEFSLLSSDFQTIPAYTNVLIVAQPEPLTEAQQFALDQYVLKGGKLLLLLDPASTIARDGGGGQQQGTQALGRLTQAWGFSVQGDVIADRTYALPVQTGLAGRAAIAPQPLIFQVPASGLNQDQAITRALSQGVHVATPGEVVRLGQIGTSFTPLLTSSPDTMRLEAKRALSGLSPQDIELDWQSSGQRQVLAAEVSGSWRTAFPNGNPAKRQVDALAASDKPGQILVVGDVDLLADSLYVDDTGSVADNARLILSSVDYLAGKTQLVELRSRTPRPRNLVEVEKLRQAAQARVLEEEQALESRLALAETRLKEIEAKEAAKDLIASDVTDTELAQVRQEVQEARTRLRAVQEGVREGVARIKTRLMVIPSIVIPLLIVLAGLLVQVFRRRQQRRLAQ